MSDTPNPGPLASSAEFDARLKRTDENRWLASRYAPEAGRERLVAVWLLHQELLRALQAKEAMLAKIRIQWWRETLEGIPDSPRRHDLTLELARVTAGRPDLLKALHGMVDAFDDVVDDHLHDGGHDPGGAHEAKHYAAEAAVVKAAGLALREGLTAEESEALARCGEAALARKAGMADAEARWKAADEAAQKLAPDLWPAVAHLAVQGVEGAPLKQRWRVLKAMMGRRL
jgi:phytoene synthase